MASLCLKALSKAKYVSGKESSVTRLIAGADVHLCNRFGRTPLHRTAVVEKDGFVGYRVPEGKVPISENERMEAAAILIAHGVNINKPDNRGWTALHLASKNKLNSLVELLIFKGADINLKDKAGRTPLEVTRSKDTKEILQRHVNVRAALNKI